MLTHSFIYSDPTRETVTICIDDLPLIDKFLKDIMDSIKSCAFHHEVEECRSYCNLYLDIVHEYNIVQDARFERLEKEKAEAEAKAKEETPEVNENDPCGRIEF